MKGGCLCGNCGYTFQGEAKFSIQCFCRDCQHISGGGHLPQMGVAALGFSHSGPVRSFSTKSASGNDLEFFFCGDCGVHMFKTTTMAKEIVFVYPGSLDDPGKFTPGKDVFEDARLVWDTT